MARGLNRTEIIGYLGTEPELRYSPQGIARATFRMAVTEQWYDSDEHLQKHTEWFRVVAFGRLGEICGEYLRTGTRVYVAGRLRTRTWQDDTDQRHQITELVADDMIMLDTRQPETEPAVTEAVAENAAAAPTPSSRTRQGQRSSKPA